MRKLRIPCIFERYFKPMAEILRKTVDQNTVYAVWHITESVGELHSAIILNNDEEELYSSFVVESRKKQWLAYRILIRKLLEPDEFKVEYDPFGKPFLAGSDFHISVTHTDDLAAVIISKAGRTGIDIEKIKSRIEKVKHKFVNDTEHLMLIPGKELELITLIWCAKEALYKLYGERALDFKENMMVDVPDCVGIPFKGRINHEGKMSHFRLYSEMVRDSILVYLVE
jgi:4'-phosphopantetheinyl transferase